MTYELVLGDCRDLLPTLADFDAVITDPPYPDYHIAKYEQTPIDFLDSLACRQFVFWSSKVDFPLSYSAIHIWDKKTGAGSQYERIFERNGGAEYKVFRHYFINSTVAASFTGDTFTGHPSQKPLRLIAELIRLYTKPKDTVVDFFMGSGTTGVACIKAGRNFIGIEKDEHYFSVAQKRIADAAAQPMLLDVTA